MRATRGDAEHTLAVFIDFENLALGFHGRRDRFNIERVLERLVEKGKIVVKKAYCDWSRFGTYTGPLHESAIELIEIPKRSATGKNSADIRLVVDAIDLAYSKDHIDTFVVVSGDSDFSPLVSKLKELGKHVIGLGLANATSELLRDNCDEFIYYEDLGRAPAAAIVTEEGLPETKQKAFALLMDSLLALRRENKDTIYSSMVKDTMKRKKPSFNEEYHGYRTFSELLEDAEKHGLLELEKHKNSGTYVVTRFGSEPKVEKPAERPAERHPGENGDRERTGRRRRRRGNGDKEARPAEAAPAAATAPPPAAPKPAAPPPPAAPKPARAPAAPVTPAAPADDRDELPLGRALIDDVDIMDDEEVVPSYGPQRKQPVAARPAVAAEKKPAAAAKKPATAHAQPKKPAAAQPEPARRKQPAAAEQPRKQPAPSEPARRRPPAEEKPAARKPAPAPKEADEESSFGAGLDL